MNGFVEVKQCPSCEGNLKKHITAISAPAMVIQFCDGDLPVMTVTEYVECVSCGLVIQSPRMTDERIDHYYSSGLYRQTLGLSQEAMDADELARSLEVAKWTLERCTPLSHVDIGSSRGYLLAAMTADVKQGYDRNPAYGKAESDKSKLDKYELLTSIHVLEHVTDPVSDLAWYRSLCDYMVLEVPGKDCMGGPYRFAHLFYYPPNVLMGMVEYAGFEIVATKIEANTRIFAKAL